MGGGAGYVARSLFDFELQSVRWERPACLVRGDRAIEEMQIRDFTGWLVVLKTDM